MLPSESYVAAKKHRSSNIEIYRIICMMMIVAHHYVVNSGLVIEGSPFWNDYTSDKSIIMSLFGAWGKTGINCFLMITGYYMCTSKITIRKFVKLMCQIYFYKILLFPILLIAGYETLSFTRLLKLVMPSWGFSDNFVGCFIGFWLTIPFLNILIHNMTRKQHQLLVILMLTMYTIFGSLPTFNVTINYVIWFGIIFFVASYIRLYPNSIFEKKALWGWLTLICIVLAIISVVGMQSLFGSSEKIKFSYFFVSDCNKIFAMAIAVCSFVWFKNVKIRYNRLINAFGAGTFGVLLIHANSDAMRTWLWNDTIDCVGNYSTMAIGDLVIYSIGTVLTIFIICNLIDQLRIATFEKWFFNWYDRSLSAKAEMWINRMI